MKKIWNPKKSGVGSVAAMCSALAVNGRLLQADDLPHWIDHTLLKPEADTHAIERLCVEAIYHSFHSVCVNPFWVKRVAESLKSSSVRTCSVIGFPFGAQHSHCKLQEATQAMADGADELDMVINLGALKSKMFSVVGDDIMGVARLCREHQMILKVILETALLSDAEIKEACRIAVDAGAHFVKTSTGFVQPGATLHGVRLMRTAVGDELGVKASGGISDRETALAMIEAGATRIGTSKGVMIVQKENSSL